MNEDNSAIFQQIAPSSLGKGELRKREIIIKTIEFAGKDGLESATFDKIAKYVGATRPLLNHYFKTRDQLFFLCAEFVRLKIQNDVIDKMKKARSTDDLIMNYIKANLDWYKNDRTSLRFWVQYMIFAMNYPTLTEQNRKFVQMGLSRIEEMINEGIANKKLKLPKNMNARMVARNIQLEITGALVSLITEDENDFHQEEKAVLESCRLLLGLK